MKTPATSKAAAKRQAARIAARKQKTRRVIVTVAVILAVILIVTPLALFANGAIYRIIPAGTVNGINFSVCDFNYYYNAVFQSTYQTFQSQYGEYASAILDTSKSFRDQIYSGDMSWDDYFRSAALSNIRTNVMLNDEAKAAGFTLSAEQQETLDSLIAVVSTTAAQYNYSADGYLQAAYGPGMNLGVYKKNITASYIADCYATFVSDSMTYTAEELQAHYEANPNNYDTVSFHSYLITAVQSETVDAETAIANAKVAADEMAANAKDTAGFHEYVLKNASEDDLATYADENATLQKFVSYESVSSAAYGEWLFDAARKAGDTTVVDASGGYQVIMFVDREDTRYPMINIRHILITPEADETTNEVTDEAWAAAEAKANELYESWKAGEATEASFAALANKNSADGDGTTGGLYENVSKGRMVQQFNDWCFADGRQVGDTGIVKTRYGYHIMYFSGFGEDYWTSTITSEMRSEEYNAWKTEKLAAYTAEHVNLGQRLVRNFPKG